MTVIIFVLGGVATLALAMFGVFYSSHKSASIWIMFSCVVLYALASCLFWQQQVATEQTSDVLHFRTQNSIISNSSRGGMFWVRYTSGFGDTLSPMPIAISLIMTNSSSLPITVNLLTVEVREKRGTWMPLEHIPTAGQRIYFIDDDFAVSRLLDFSTNGLDQLMAAERSVIAPNKALKGWVFFNRPLNFENGENIDLEYRFTAEDTTGKKYVEIPPASVMAKNPPIKPEFSLSPSSLEWTGVTEDLHGLAFKPWPPYPHAN